MNRTPATTQEDTMALTDTLRARSRRALAASAAGLLVAALPVGAAAADPKPYPDQTSTLTCGGTTYGIVLTPSNGEWTPALDSASTRVFQPVGFIETHFEVTGYNEDGSIAFTESGSEPGAAKRGQRKGQDVVECTFESTFSGFDDYFGGYVEGSWGGTVLGVVHG
jgi:hypothetical protein